MRKGLLSFIVIGALVGVAFYGQAQLGLFRKPCSSPISYSLGTFDPKFNITQSEFLAAVDQAINVWEKPTGKDLFKYDPNGKLKINLIYDYRQEATDKLQNLGFQIDNTQASYDQLKSRYNQMHADYETLKRELESNIASYNTRKAAYEAEVNKWNKQGGAPKNEVQKLNAERDALSAQASRINRDQATLNNLANEINAVVDVLNRMAHSLNLNVSNYNNIGESRGDEFEEGAYVESGRTKQIDIYEFDSEERLVRVLAHEFGHALGLEHIDTNENAIMYRLNKGGTDTATIEDLNAVKTLCGI
jgi:vacuolar-type H+-ATPase subunit I/STV1